MTTQRPAGVHPIDLIAQELYERIQGEADWLRARLAGPTPVGTRKLTPREWARRLLQLSPQQTAELIDLLPRESPVFSTAFDMLGAHGFALLPYLQNTALLPENAAGPQPGGEEVF